MKWSFYEFGELVNEHKMQESQWKQGIPSQYAHGDPSRPNVSSSDGNTGRGTREIETKMSPEEIAALEKGAMADKAASSNRWSQAVAEDPNKEFYSKAARHKTPEELEADAESKALTAHDQENAVVGRRRVGTGKSANSELENALKNDLTPEGQMARAIDDAISNNPKAFANKPMTKMELVQKLTEVMPKGGLGGARRGQEIADGFMRLHNLAGKKLFTKVGGGKVLVNVAAVSGGGGGVDVESELAKGTGDAAKVPDMFQKTIEKLRNTVREKGEKDEHVAKLAKRAKQYGDMIRRGLNGIPSSIYGSIKDDHQYAKDIAMKNSTSGGGLDISDLLGGK